MTRVHLALGLGVVAAMFLGVSVGSVAVPIDEVVGALLGRQTEHATIITNLRTPRVLLSFAVGGSLAVCGAALQALVRNPLADPYLLGLSGGAGLAAVAALALNVHNAWAVPAAAFVGALAAVALVYRLSVVAGRRLDPRVLLLAGVVVGAFAGALMSAIMVLSNAPQLRNAFLWLLGGFGAASWQSVFLFSLYALVPLGLLFGAARVLDLLALGEEPARYLGADVDKSRRTIVLATALLTAACVATSGVIGFVGLVVPHAIRRVQGPLHRSLIPVAFLVGGAFLVLADALARTAVRPVEIPVGVVTALAGVPLFAVLLRRTLT